MRQGLKKADVARLFKQCQVVKTPFFILKLVPSAFAFSRIAFAYSRKSGTAVVRNRTKRRWRAFINELIPLSGPIDVLCLPRQSLTKLSDALWREEKNRIEKIFATHQQTGHRRS